MYIENSNRHNQFLKLDHFELLSPNEIIVI